jgi:hypothetical protein
MYLPIRPLEIFGKDPKISKSFSAKAQYGF